MVNRPSVRFRRLCGQARAVGKQHADAFDDTLAQVSGHLDVIGKDGLSFGIDNDHVAGRSHAIVIAAVDKTVCLEDVAPVGELDRTFGCRDSVAIIMVDFIGQKEGRFIQATVRLGTAGNEHKDEDCKVGKAPEYHPSSV